LFTLRPSFSARLRFALRLHPWWARLTWLTRLTLFARRALNALGACFAFRTRFASGVRRDRARARFARLALFWSLTSPCAGLRLRRAPGDRVRASATSAAPATLTAFTALTALTLGSRLGSRREGRYRCSVRPRLSCFAFDQP